jgi:HSP20 family protein
MTAITSWDLFEDLRAAQDEMLRMNRAWAGRNGHHYDGTAGSPGWAPAVDISEGEDAYLVTADLPGVRAGDVEITFEDGLLTIQGDRHQVSAADGQKVRRAERRYGPFLRSITMPSHIDLDRIEASAQDGVLQVLVPKAKDLRAKRVEVRAGNGHAAPGEGAAAMNGR